MQFLVPFLEEMPADLLKVAAVHDVQDFIPNLLSFPPAPHGDEHHADDGPGVGHALVNLREALRQPVLGMGEFPRFGIEIALPGQLPQA